MPTPASEAIASDVGHGAPGVRSALRPFRDLLGETSGQRHLWVELRPKKLLTGLIQESTVPVPADPWSKAISETFDGVVLDVVGVQTLTEALTRVERLAAVVPGTYYYDGTKVYLRLTGDADPGLTSAVAMLGVHVGSHGVYHPVLLPDRLTNGSLEAWTGTTPDGWTKFESGGTVTIDKTSSDPLEGSYAARLTFAAAGAAVNANISKNLSTAVAAGMFYRFSGAYRITCATNLLRVGLTVRDSVATGDDVQADGRTLATAPTPFLTDTDGSGAWKRFAFDFVCPAGALVQAAATVVSGTQSGTVDFDDLKLQPISRYAYYEPLLSADSLPTIEAARADSFWGPMSSGLGSLSLLNGGGRLEPLIAAYDWLGADCIVRVGGRFQLGGNETLLEDCPVLAIGKLGAPTVKDDGVTFDLTDSSDLLRLTLPTRTYNNNSGTDAYQQADRGRVRPLLFGNKDGVRPVQYDIAYPLGGAVPMGVYEVVDCDDWPYGTFGPASFDWYADDATAAARDAASRVHMAYGVTTIDGVTPDASTGRFTVNRDLHPIILTEESNKLVFHIGGGALTATLAQGAYFLYDTWSFGTPSPCLLVDLAAAMNAAAGTADIACTFDDASQKVVISKGAGTLSLLCATGSDVQTGLWSLLGFDAKTDKTGALSYTATASFTTQAYQQAVRTLWNGFRDDDVGTYTGTVWSPIVLAPDIALWLLRVALKVPLANVNVPSFVAARAVATRECSLYIGRARTVADVFEELETTGDMDLVLSGGVWSCLTRDTSTTGAVAIESSDLLAYEACYSPDDLYGTVRLTYDESPDNTEPGPNDWIPRRNTSVGEATDAAVALRFGRPDLRTFATCLLNAADATTDPARLQEIAAQCSTKRRRFRLSIKGKALRVPVNGKLLLTRSRGLDTTGALSNVLVRVISKRDDWARWVSDLEAVEIV